MKRLLILAASCLAALTLWGNPAGAHSNPSAYDICAYIRPSGYSLNAWRTIHYGSDHVTQCYFLGKAIPDRACGQHIWGVGTYYYTPTQPDWPYCW